MTRRSATTLAELVLVMSTGSALMALSVTTLHQAMTLATASRERCNSEQVRCRLTEQFRRDVHQAAESVLDSPSQLRLTIDAEAVVYTIEANRVAREQGAGDQRRRDVFRLGILRDASFETLTDPDRAALIIRRGTGLKHVLPSTERHVIAVMGRLVPRSPVDEASP